MSTVAVNKTFGIEFLRQRPAVELSQRDRDGLRQEFKLSPREIEIIRLLMRSLRESEIAEDLQISSHTVHTHLGRVYRKLNVTSVAELSLRVISLTRRLDPLH